MTTTDSILQEAVEAARQAAWTAAPPYLYHAREFDGTSLRTIMKAGLEAALPILVAHLTTSTDHQASAPGGDVVAWRYSYKGGWAFTDNEVHAEELAYLGHKVEALTLRTATPSPAEGGGAVAVYGTTSDGVHVLEPATKSQKFTRDQLREAARGQVANDDTVLPKLTEAMIRAACKGFYNTDNIDGVSLPFEGGDYTFREAFKRMWKGIRSALASSSEPAHQAASGDMRYRLEMIALSLEELAEMVAKNDYDRGQSFQAGMTARSIRAALTEAKQ